MSIKIDTSESATVYFDDRYTQRIVDVIGTGVTKYIATTDQPVDDTTGDPSGWVNTPVEVGAGTSTVANAATSGGIFLVTTAANENDGVNFQKKGTQFLQTSTNKLYVGCKLQVSDATQSDLLIGLCTTDTTLVAAHAIALGDDGIFVSCLDGSTTLAGKVYLGGAETATANYGTALADATDIYIDMYWDGETIKIYIDNTLVTSSKASLPNSVMTPSLYYAAGEAVAKTAIIKDLRVFQW